METNDHLRLAMRPLVARVTLVDTDAERMFTFRFAASPIRLGRHRRSDLRLRHPQVARWHGEIGFAKDLLFFRHRAWTKPSWVDGRRLARGEAVALNQHSIIAIGCFEIDVSLGRPAAHERERARRVTPLWRPPFSIVELARDGAMPAAIAAALDVSEGAESAATCMGYADDGPAADADAGADNRLRTRTFSPEARRLLR